MSPTIQDLGIDRLSAEDRLRLIGEIWDSLADADTLDIPQAHREAMDRKAAAADSNPADGLALG